MQSIDLIEHESETTTDFASVCIVGAGAAGLFLARRLSDAGIDTIIVEAGSERVIKAAETDLQPEFSQDIYDGAINGRGFGLGGSTALWGGVLVPYTRHDLRSTDKDNESVWRHIVDTVQTESGTVLATLGLPGRDDFQSFASGRVSVETVLKSVDVEVVSPIMLRFGNRNFANLFRAATMQRQTRIYLNAVACSWEAKDGRLIAVTAMSRNHKRVVVSAKQFVVAAGTIESTRLLLEMRDEHPECNVSPKASIGAHFSDHISTGVAVAHGKDAGAIAKLFAPRFDGPMLRMFYLIDRDAAQRRSFFRFIFERFDRGFLVARRTLQALQARRWPDVSATEYLQSIGGLSALAWSRYLRKQLYVPTGAAAHLYVDIEQQPINQNAVMLASDRDAFGRRRARINWAISTADMSAVQQIADEFLAKWRRNRTLPTLQPVPLGAVSKPHDVYHPVGACRMGLDSGAVVDLDLRVRGTMNLWALTTGVFPTAGSANPTFSMLCFAASLGQTLKSRLSA